MLGLKLWPVLQDLQDVGESYVFQRTVVLTVDKDKTFHMHHYSQDTSKSFIVLEAIPVLNGYFENSGSFCQMWTCSVWKAICTDCQRNFWSKQELGPDEPLVLPSLRFLAILLFATLLAQQREIESGIKTILWNQLGLKKITHRSISILSEFCYFI